MFANFKMHLLRSMLTGNPHYDLSRDWSPDCLAFAQSLDASPDADYTDTLPPWEESERQLCLLAQWEERDTIPATMSPVRQRIIERHWGRLCESVQARLQCSPAFLELVLSEYAWRLYSGESIGLRSVLIALSNQDSGSQCSRWTQPATLPDEFAAPDAVWIDPVDLCNAVRAILGAAFGQSRGERNRLATLGALAAGAGSKAKAAEIAGVTVRTIRSHLNALAAELPIRAVMMLAVGMIDNEPATMGNDYPRATCRKPTGRPMASPPLRAMLSA